MDFSFTLTNKIAIAEEMTVSCELHYLSAGAIAMIQRFHVHNVRTFIDFKLLFHWFPPKHLFFLDIKQQASIID